MPITQYLLPLKNKQLNCPAMPQWIYSRCNPPLPPKNIQERRTPRAAHPNLPLLPRTPPHLRPQKRHLPIVQAVGHDVQAEYICVLDALRNAKGGRVDIEGLWAHFGDGSVVADEHYWGYMVGLPGWFSLGEWIRTGLAWCANDLFFSWIKAWYIRCISELLNVSLHAVKYEAATTLTMLTRNPAAV